ncbi:MAG: T9SS type A sorting domain-containing protein [Bacteroidota bacterium]|nr:T9SS type A sorting domain-containing protein [Bacteroidota bacterium]
MWICVRVFSLILIIVLLGFSAKSQLSGIKSIPGDYPDLAAAIADLNNHGPGSGGVTFNILASQTAPEGGYLITATGTSSNPVIFHGNNNTVLAAGTTTNTDGIFKLVGSDYITITNFILSGDSSVEWGVALLKKVTGIKRDGCQYNVFSRLTITLDKNNVKSVGIYGAHHSSTDTTVLSWDGYSSEANSWNQILSNNISNVYIGIKLTGIITPYPNAIEYAYDKGNVIGYPDGQGNRIFDFGGKIETAYGIKVEQSIGVWIRANKITLSERTLGQAYGIAASSGNGNVEYDTISLQSTLALSGIDVSNAGMYVIGNVVKGCSNLTGDFHGISSKGGYCYSNQVIENRSSGSNMYLISYSAGGEVGNSQLYHNVKRGAGSLFCVYLTSASASGNQIYTDSIITADPGASASIYGIYFSNAAGSVYEMCSGNTIYNLIFSGATTTQSSVISGIYSQTMGGNRVYSSNKIYGLNFNNSSTGGARVSGICEDNGLGIYISGNKIGSLRADGPTSTIYGLHIGFTGSSVMFNNLIGNLYAPEANVDNAVRGLDINGSGDIDVCFNTIVLHAASSGNNFGSSAISVSSDTRLTMWSNIFINNSNPGINGRSVSYRRSSDSLETYGPLSNNNLFYAGTPGVHHLIFYDSVNGDSSLELYKNRVGTRDSLSVQENTRFLDTVVMSAYFLHVDTTIATLAESGGASIVTTNGNSDGNIADYDGDRRYGHPYYTGSGFAPDIGADEFEGLSFLQNDVGVTTLSEPSACFSSGGVTTVVVRNYGPRAINFSRRPVTVRLHITGVVDIEKDTVLNAGILFPATTIAVNMFDSLDMFASGTYIFNASTSLANDLDTTNDAMIEAIRAGGHPATLPILVDFNGYDGTNLAETFPNWKEGSGVNSPSGTQSSWTSCSDLGAAGNSSAKIRLSGNTANEWIISPYVIPAPALELKLKAALTGHGSLTNSAVMGADDKVSVMVSADCGASWAAIKDFTAADALTPVLTEFTIYTPSYSTQKIVVALRATDGQVDDPNDYDFHIDDLRLQAVPFALPVELLSFSGQRTRNINLLKWSTASEQNVKGFQVERSGDALHYDPISFINSKANGGNSDTRLDYEYTDDNITGDKQYYRLNEYDIDGKSHFSNVILVRNNNPSHLVVAGLYPNPVTSALQAAIQSPYRDDIKFFVLNSLGQVVKEKSAVVERGINTIDLDTQNLLPGIYIVKVRSQANNEIATGKFVKQ